MFSYISLFVIVVTAFLIGLVLTHLSLPYALLALPVWTLGSGIAALADSGFDVGSPSKHTKGHPQYNPKLAVATYLVVTLLSSVFLLVVVR